MVVGSTIVERPNGAQRNAGPSEKRATDRPDRDQGFLPFFGKINDL